MNERKDGIDETYSDFIEKRMISRPLVEGSAQITISPDRLSKLKALNQQLDSLSQDESLTKLNEMNKKIYESRNKINEIKYKMPSLEEVDKYKKKREKMVEIADEIKEKNEKCEKYDQAKVFLSILIEKTIPLLYPSLANEENIHEKLIHSVEEDNNFQYGKYLLDRIKSDQKS